MDLARPLLAPCVALILTAALVRVDWAALAGHVRRPGLVLVLTLLVGLLAPAHGYFGVDGSFGFNAWYGFATCVGMILVARALGYFLKRRDSYYDRD